MKKFLLVILFLQFTAVFTQNEPIVWINAEGGERNEYVYFRRDVSLNEKPTEASINLYADSRYALYVNEVYIGFGPARTFHKNPTYDTYNIAPYLNKGKNTIAVKALSNGMVTFQLFDYKGGFTTWGEIKDGNKTIDLSIQNEWLCKKSEGYDQTADRLSFATGAIENIDTRKDAGWSAIETLTNTWQKPIALKNQKQWGKLTPRIIPHLTQQETTAVELMGAYALDTTETIYSFRIPVVDEIHEDYSIRYNALAYTYIYSPENKEITVGLWWGDYYLNGEKIEENKDQKKNRYRKNYQLKLNKGWNLFLTQQLVIWGTWDYYMTLPKGEGIMISPTKKADSKEIFKTYGPIPEKENAIGNLDMSQSIKTIKKKLGKNWNGQKRSETANHPARDIAWYTIDYETSLIQKNDISSNTLTIPMHPKGTALVYDMGEIQLGRFFVEGDFPEGTIIDIGFSEEKNIEENRPWFYKRYQIGAGHRFITADGQKRYETFKPYGARYLQVNIRNNNKTATVDKVGMIRQVYPFEQVGSFNCSDPLLNRIWEAGWRTLQLCAEDSYTDTPFRERGLYAGDMLPEAAITMAVSGDTRLLEHSLNIFQDMYHDEMYSGKENRHADFPLITLVTLDYYLQYTGDWTFVEKHYNNYKSLLLQYLKRKNRDGLQHNSQVFIEWTKLNKHDAVMTAQQALVVKSMYILSNWATKLNKPEDASFFKQEAKALTKAVNTMLWDESTNSYWDGIKNDSLIDKHHITSSIWPALYNVSDAIRKEKIIEMLKAETQNIMTGFRQNKIAPYSLFYLFALLYQSGEADLAEALMKKHWGPMALHAAKPTVWENFSISGNLGTSSHAWSGHPTYYLSSEVLGVNLGFYKKLNRDVIEIEPQSATVNWAEGSVAHPLGKVSVSWKIIGSRLVLDYTAPKGANVIVKPKGRLGDLELWVNGNLY